MNIRQGKERHKGNKVIDADTLQLIANERLNHFFDSELPGIAEGALCIILLDSKYDEIQKTYILLEILDVVDCIEKEGYFMAYYEKK